MIENPAVGQRVFRAWANGEGQWATIRELRGTPYTPRILIEYDDGCLLDTPVDGGDLYATASEAAAALRAEGQRLIEAADKLEQKHKHMKKTDGYTSKDSIYSGCKLPRKIEGIRTVGQMRKALEEYHDEMRLGMRNDTMTVFVTNVGRDDEHLVIEEDWDDI